MQIDQTNKDVVISFYKRAIGAGDLDYANQVIADDYVQHSHAVEPGKEGIMKALTFLKKMPKASSATPPAMRIIADGAYVLVHLSVPVGPTRKAVCDIFRLRDGQLAEHWDVMQTEPTQTVHGHCMTDGSMDIGDSMLTSVNKVLIDNFCRVVFIQKQYARLSEYVSEDMIQHDPLIGDGRMTWEVYLKAAHETMSAHEIIHILGEGNFVAVHVQKAAQHCIHIFRVSGNKIAEHWSIVND